jgi:hypothetical protein
MTEMLKPRSYDSLKKELRGVITDLLDRVRDHAADEAERRDGRLRVGQCRNAAIAAASSSLGRSTSVGTGAIAVTSTITLTAVIERNRRSISYEPRWRPAYRYMTLARR